MMVKTYGNFLFQGYFGANPVPNAPQYGDIHWLIILVHRRFNNIPPSSYWLDSQGHPPQDVGTCLGTYSFPKMATVM